MTMHRAQVDYDFTYDGVRIRLGRQLADRFILRNLIGGSDLIAEPGQGNPADMEPYTLRLRDDEVRALWEELNRYFGAQPAAQTDRADLMAERARVDKLVDVVSRIALAKDGMSQRSGES